MAGLLEKFQSAFAAIHPPRSRGRLVVAVSGGVDSVVLLDLLVRTVGKERLVVAHFNHGLRGRSSAADERFVHELARRYGVKFAVGRGPVRAEAERRGHSIEMAARDLRHRFLAQTAKRQRAPFVVLAHHADDQVELFFLRLLRGSAPGSLAGMAPCSVSPAGGRVRLLRPLLGVTKVELESFARAQGLKFRLDQSNRSLEFLRNRVRHELLPLLRRCYQPGLDAVVLRLAVQLGDWGELVSGAADLWLRQDPRPAWEGLPAAVQREVLARQLAGMGLSPEYRLIEELRVKADTAVSAVAGKLVKRKPDGTLQTVRAASPRFSAAQRVIDLTRPGRVSFGGVKLSWRRVPLSRWRQALAKRPPNTELFDAVALGDRVLLRHWRPGDRFHAFGMPGPARLQDWFVNRKVPREQRARLVLAEAAGGVLSWVEGQRLGHAFQLGPKTRTMLVWQWQRDA